MTFTLRTPQSRLGPQRVSFTRAQPGRCLSTVPLGWDGVHLGSPTSASLYWFASKLGRCIGTPFSNPRWLCRNLPSLPHGLRWQAGWNGWAAVKKCLSGTACREDWSLTECWVTCERGPAEIPGRPWVFRAGLCRFKGISVPLA